MKNRLFALVLAAVMLVSVACGASAMTAGTYTKTVGAMHGPMTIEVVLAADKIESVKVLEHVETPGVGDQAVLDIPVRIVENQTAEVDVVTGVTITSRVIMSAVSSILKEAGADMAVYGKAAEKAPAQDASLLCWR